MSSTSTGTIVCASISDLVHEVRKATHSAHRAHKRSQNYGPIQITDGVARITLTCDHAGAELPQKPDSVAG